MHRISLLIIVAVAWANIGHAASFEDLYQQGKNRLAEEQYSLAITALNEAQPLAVSPEQQAYAAGTLGLTYYRMQRWEQAKTFLQKTTALNVGDPLVRASWLGALADLATNKGQLEIAKPLYEQALLSAKNDPALVLALRLGQVDVLPLTQRLSELLSIKDHLGANTSSEAQLRLLINLGIKASKTGSVGLELAFASFEQARQHTESFPRLRAEAIGQLAQLYEQDSRYLEALNLNELAINDAQKIEAHDLLLELQWRQGRLQRHLQHLPEATAAYQQAIEHIEAIRHDIPVEYQNGRSSFREILEPVYLGLVDLLLLQASQKDVVNKNNLLLQARATVELIKQTELEDFLGGRCTVHSNKKALLEDIDASTAIIYPIILPDRLEILVSSGNEIKQYTQAISAVKLQELSKHLAHSLRTSKYDIKSTSQLLYQSLITPIEPWLKQRKIQTLVMVPDGVLRLIPLAVLHDGKHYLIENYAIATSPGLTLLDSTSVQKHELKVLLAGMSVPGSVIENLPVAFFQATTGHRGGNAEDLSESAVKSRKLEMDHLLKEPAFRQHLKEKLSLPGVAEEITSLKKELPNTVLMNESFTVEGFKKQAMLEPYSVVHIASHGVFGKTADTSFIMTYDGILNMDALEQLLKSDKFSKQPVELLTLSACQTAEGDDRAPLGLSGIALKAKVRSVLGTLWPVSDQAASVLMTDFYKALSAPNTSKAQALRLAQIALIKQKQFENPFYWSPFILAGNWL